MEKGVRNLRFFTTLVLWRHVTAICGNLRATAEKQAPMQRSPPAITLRERRGNIIENTPQMCGRLNRIAEMPTPTQLSLLWLPSEGRFAARLTSMPLSPGSTIAGQIVEQDKRIMNSLADLTGFSKVCSRNRNATGRWAWPVAVQMIRMYTMILGTPPSRWAIVANAKTFKQVYFCLSLVIVLSLFVSRILNFWEGCRAQKRGWIDCILITWWF